MEVAKWLKQICPELNIRAKNDYAFNHANYFNHPEVAKWLATMCDEYVIHDKNKKTKN